MMCAEVSRRGGMLYGLAAPVAEYPREVPRLMGVLRSFAFAAPRNPGAPGDGPGGGPMPALRSWQEPQEMAYTLSIPAGWNVIGGIRRSDVTHYTNGVIATSPDGGSQIRIGDQRLPECSVAGPGMASVSGGRMPQGYCGDQSGPQLGQFYVTQWMPRDLGLNGLKVTSVIDRPDLAQRAQASIMPGLRVRYSIGEVRFEGVRNGAPVQGAVLGQTTLFHAAQGQNFLLGTLSFQVQGFVGPAAQFDMLARLTGVVASSLRVNPTWWSQNQQIGRDVAERTLAAMRQQAEHQQQAFWDRMASMDRRREGMRGILGGTVRLSDGQGNQYEAKAGSNYYFFDQEAGRTAPRPDDAGAPYRRLARQYRGPHSARSDAVRRASAQPAASATAASGCAARRSSGSRKWGRAALPMAIATLRRKPRCFARRTGLPWKILLNSSSLSAARRSSGGA